MKYFILISLLFSFAIAQKKQSVTLKPGTTTLEVKASKYQSFTVLVNGKSYAVNGEQVPSDTAVYLKDYSSWNEAVAAAQAKNKTLMLPAVYNPGSPLYINGDLRVSAAPGSKVVHPLFFKGEYTFVLGAGTHRFSNIEFEVVGNGYSTFQTVQDKIVFNNQFYNCKFTGPWNINYQSSVGAAGSTTSFINCNLFATNENIQYYSQAGPKTLIIRNSVFQSVTSHNIYSHPINSHEIDGYTCNGAAINAINIYATAKEMISGYKNEIASFKNMRCSDTAVATKKGGRPSFRLGSSSAPVIIDNCNIAPYEVAGKVFASNSYFYNDGNGVALGHDAELTNCSGDVEVREGHSITLNDCQFNSFTVASGAKVFASNSKISNMITQPHRGTYNKIEFGDYQITSNESFANDVVFTNCIFKLSTYKYFRVWGDFKGFTFVKTKIPQAWDMNNRKEIQMEGN